LKIAVPIYSIKISPPEMEQAKAVRTSLKDVILSLDKITDSLDEFSKVMSEVVNPEDLLKLRKELVAYRHKVQNDLNDFLTLVEQSLSEWNRMISDSNFDAMRRAYVEDIRKIRDSSIEFLEKMRNPADPKFLQDVPQDVNSIIAAKKSLHEIVSVQLFQKIDRDILGRIKIGSKIKNI
jgi:predicted ATP-binding protein involved in virulence